MLTGDWPHFVCMIANLKWPLSTSGQLYSLFTQYPIGPVNTFTSPLRPQIPLLHYALLVDDLTFHCTKKMEAIQRELSSLLTTNLPHSLSVPLCSAFLPGMVDKCCGLQSKISISTCYLDVFLSCQSRTLSL